MQIHHPEIYSPAEGFKMVAAKRITVGNWEHSLELENGEVAQVYIHSISVHHQAGYKNLNVVKIQFSQFVQTEDGKDENIKVGTIYRDMNSPVFIQDMDHPAFA